MMRPWIGITTDVTESARLTAQSALTYSRAVAAAGGLPMLLAPIPELIPEYLTSCRGFVFTGGADVRMDKFGEALHPAASPVHPLRQEFELALFDALRPHRTPVLGICLGMQLMSLHAGGKLIQHLPDCNPHAEQHRNQDHLIRPIHADPSSLGLSSLVEARSHSNHHQAISDPGTLSVLAMSPDGVIEAVADTTRPFYVGVQWHPERTADSNLGAGIFESLLAAVRAGA